MKLHSNLYLSRFTKSMDAAEVTNGAEGDDPLTQENLTLADHHLPVSSPLSKGASKTHIRSSSSRNCRAVKSWPQGFPGVKSSSMVRAVNFQSNLGSEFPSFVKALPRSYVSGRCSMALPTWFCYSHLPKENTTIVLEDENKRCYDIYYLAHKPGLSGGWRRFTVEQNYLEGDVLVFHLIRPTKFKVYRITPHDKAEADGAAVGLPILEDRPKQANAEAHAKRGMATCISRKRKPGELLSAERKIKRTDCPSENESEKVTLELSENQSEKCDSDPSQSVIVSDKIGSEFGVTVDRFRDVHCFRNFEVSLNELLMQSVLEDHTRNKYYELCRSQSALLHKHLLKGMDAKLIAGIISETVNMADALRACKLSTSPDELSTWDKTVIAFELLGMDVGFLRVRVERLRNLILRSEAAKERKRTLEDEIRELEAKLIELKEAGRQQRKSLEALNMEAESYEQDFFDVVNAPW